jgi:hypothetical protein
LFALDYLNTALNASAGSLSGRTISRKRALPRLQALGAPRHRWNIAIDSPAKI